MSHYHAPVTMILDLDATIIASPNRSLEEQLVNDLVFLPGSKEKLFEWDRQGFRIYILTGRPLGTFARTEEQLKKANIPYTQLICGAGGGPRILVNDEKPDGRKTAFAYSLKPNVGMGEVNTENLYQENPLKVNYGQDLCKQEDIEILKKNGNFKVYRDKLNG